MPWRTSSPKYSTYLDNQGQGVKDRSRPFCRSSTSLMQKSCSGHKTRRGPKPNASCLVAQLYPTHHRIKQHGRWYELLYRLWCPRQLGTDQENSKLWRKDRHSFVQEVSSCSGRSPFLLIISPLFLSYPAFCFFPTNEQQDVWVGTCRQGDLWI